MNSIVPRSRPPARPARLALARRLALIAGVDTRGPCRASACQPSPRRRPDRRRPDGRARLHPERPVRPVLPRPAGGLLRGGRPRRDVPEQDRPRPRHAASARARVDVGLADGTSVIPAVSQGIPVRYVATIYGKFPNVVFAKASSGITSAGRPQGQEARHSRASTVSSWIMLQALLQSAGLTHRRRADRRRTPTTARPSRSSRARSTRRPGFANNEPVQLELERHADRRSSTSTRSRRCPAPASSSGAKTLSDKHAALAGFVAATLRGDERDRGRPERGPTPPPSTAVPELAKDPATQQAMLAATIATWQSPYTQVHGLGAIDRDAWARSITFMSGLPDHPVAVPVTVDQVVDGGLLGG